VQQAHEASSASPQTGTQGGNSPFPARAPNEPESKHWKRLFVGLALGAGFGAALGYAAAALGYATQRSIFGTESYIFGAIIGASCGLALAITWETEVVQDSWEILSTGIQAALFFLVEHFLVVMINVVRGSEATTDGIAEILYWADFVGALGAVIVVAVHMLGFVALCIMSTIFSLSNRRDRHSRRC
jgi:hypothetical protein